NQTLIRQLIQEKIPFNEDQIHQAAALLAKAGDKSAAIDILKHMVAMKLPLTEATLQAIQMNRQESLSNLMYQVYNELSQQKTSTTAERTLMQQLETLLSRPAESQSSAFTQQILQSIKPSSQVMNA